MDDLFVLWMDKDTYRPGEMASGKVSFPAQNAKLSQVRSVKVRVAARIYGSGNTESVVATEVLVLQGPVTAPVEVPFSAQLPAQGPVSWQGRYVKVEWSAKAELDVPWTLNRERSFEFQVVPRGA